MFSFSLAYLPFQFYKGGSWGQRHLKTCSRPIGHSSATLCGDSAQTMQRSRAEDEATLNPSPTQPVPAGSASFSGPCCARSAWQCLPGNPCLALCGDPLGLSCPCGQALRRLKKCWNKRRAEPLWFTRHFPYISSHLHILVSRSEKAAGGKTSLVLPNCFVISSLPHIWQHFTVSRVPSVSGSPLTLTSLGWRWDGDCPHLLNYLLKVCPTSGPFT